MTSLISEIQAAAIDGKSSLTDALRKAKVASAKLGLQEFQRWIDNELRGYPSVSFADMPEYRKVIGRPQSWNPHHGWQNIRFGSQETADLISTAPINSSIAQLEAALAGTDSSGIFEFSYSVDQADQIRDAMGWNTAVRLALDPQVGHGILSHVRDILTDWTLELERQGITGEGMSFTPEDRSRSETATASVIHNYHMGPVGSFVQSAQQSVVQGGINSSFSMDRVSDLVTQIEAQRENLPADIWRSIQVELTAIRAELAAAKRPSVIRQSLQAIAGVCSKITASVAATGIEHLIAPLLNSFGVG